MFTAPSSRENGTSWESEVKRHIIAGTVDVDWETARQPHRQHTPQGQVGHTAGPVIIFQHPSFRQKWKDTDSDDKVDAGLVCTDMRVQEWERSKKVLKPFLTFRPKWWIKIVVTYAHEWEPWMNMNNDDDDDDEKLKNWKGKEECF